MHVYVYVCVCVLVYVYVYQRVNQSELKNELKRKEMKLQRKKGADKRPVALLLLGSRRNWPVGRSAQHHFHSSPSTTSPANPFPKLPHSNPPKPPTFVSTSSTPLIQYPVRPPSRPVLRGWMILGRWSLNQVYRRAVCVVLVAQGSLFVSFSIPFFVSSSYPSFQFASHPSQLVICIFPISSSISFLSLSIIFPSFPSVSPISFPNISSHSISVFFLLHDSPFFIFSFLILLFSLFFQFHSQHLFFFFLYFLFFSSFDIFELLSLIFSRSFVHFCPIYLSYSFDKAYVQIFFVFSIFVQVLAILNMSPGITSDLYKTE